MTDISLSTPNSLLASAGEYNAKFYFVCTYVTVPSLPTFIILSPLQQVSCMQMYLTCKCVTGNDRCVSFCPPNPLSTSGGELHANTSVYTNVIQKYPNGLACKCVFGNN